MYWKNRSHEEHYWWKVPHSSAAFCKYHVLTHPTALQYMPVKHTKPEQLSLLPGGRRVKSLREGRPRAEGSSHYRRCKVTSVPLQRQNPPWARVHGANSWGKSEKLLSSCGCLVRVTTLCWCGCRCERCFRESGKVTVCLGWSKEALGAALTNSSFHVLRHAFLTFALLHSWR